MCSTWKISAVAFVILVSTTNFAWADKNKDSARDPRRGNPSGGNIGGGNVINNNLQPPTARSINIPNRNVVEPKRNVVVPNITIPKVTVPNNPPRINLPPVIIKNNDKTPPVITGKVFSAPVNKNANVPVQLPIVKNLPVIKPVEGIKEHKPILGNAGNSTPPVDVKKYQTPPIFVPRNANNTPPVIKNPEKDVKKYQTPPIFVPRNANNTPPVIKNPAKDVNTLPPVTIVAQPRTGILGNDLKHLPTAKKFIPPVNNIVQPHTGIIGNDFKHLQPQNNFNHPQTGNPGTNFKIYHTNKPLPKPILPPNKQPGHDHDPDHHDHDAHNHHHHHGHANYYPYYFRPYGYSNYSYGYNSPYYGSGYGYSSPYLSFGSSRFGVSFLTGAAYSAYNYAPNTSYYGASYAVPNYGTSPSYEASTSYGTGSRIIVSRPVETGPTLPAADGSAATSHDFAEQGESDFKAGNYKEAVKNWRHALVDEPENNAYLLLLSQGFFATGEFDEAAGAAQQAARNLPAEHWNVVIKNYKELYANIQDYTDQLRALEKARNEKPDSPALRFLLGWHYGYLGYPREAIVELDKLLEFMPEDEIGKQLREQFVAQIPKDEVPLAPVEGKKI